MVKMEQRGKPAAAIVSGGFEEDAAITGRVLGLPDLKYITVPDVLTGLPDEQIRLEGEDALAEAKEILTSTPGAPRVRARGGQRARGVLEAETGRRRRFRLRDLLRPRGGLVCLVTVREMGVEIHAARPVFVPDFVAVVVDAFGK